MARVVGSYPTCHPFESDRRYHELTIAMIHCDGQFFYFAYQESLQYKAFAPQGYSKRFVLQAFLRYRGLGESSARSINLNTP